VMKSSLLDASMAKLCVSMPSQDTEGVPPVSTTTDLQLAQLWATHWLCLSLPIRNAQIKHSAVSKRLAAQLTNLHC
jgi:hypothetical protein